MMPLTMMTHRRVWLDKYSILVTYVCDVQMETRERIMEKKEVSAFISLIRDQKYMVYKLQINVWCAEYVASTSSYMV